MRLARANATSPPASSGTSEEDARGVLHPPQLPRSQSRVLTLGFRRENAQEQEPISCCMLFLCAASMAIISHCVMHHRLASFSFAIHAVFALF